MIGNDKALEFVVMATTDDIEANQEYISEGDFLVEVPSGPTNNNYTNLYLIVQVRPTKIHHTCMVLLYVLREFSQFSNLIIFPFFWFFFYRLLKSMSVMQYGLVGVMHLRILSFL